MKTNYECPLCNGTGGIEDGDLVAALTRIHDKLDKILLSCCTHERTVASMNKGDPILCEDCRKVVGYVQ